RRPGSAQAHVAKTGDALPACAWSGGQGAAVRCGAQQRHAAGEMVVLERRSPAGWCEVGTSASR
ncbi:hypothetical protein, partial [Burkholderia sp.]|uniref:hypothetical protein n=1 Tax=Burkholderia sp. TaxID=36773 RepID=UPI00258BFF9A